MIRPTVNTRVVDIRAKLETVETKMKLKTEIEAAVPRIPQLPTINKTGIVEMTPIVVTDTEQVVPTVATMTDAPTIAPTPAPTGAPTVPTQTPTASPTTEAPTSTPTATIIPTGVPVSYTHLTLPTKA